MGRSWKKIFGNRLLSCGMAACLLVSLAGFKVSAAEGPYTYSVTIHAGKQGSIKELSGLTVEKDGVKVDGYTVTGSGDKVVLSGLSYGDRVTFDVKRSVVMKDAETAASADTTVSGGNASVSRYQVRGLRESGRDNGAAAAASFVVTEDRDYVVAYSINGKMVAYTVNYQDESGNKLAESRTYYGNVGDMPVVGYVYIDNYRPQAYNLTKTLDADETKNVFTFVYTPMERGGGGGGGAGTNETVTVIVPGENGGVQAGTTTIGQGGAGGAGGAAEEAPGAGAGAGAGEAEAPQEPQELINLDDEEVPLANVEVEDEKVPLAGKVAGDRPFPLVAGIVIAVLAVVVIVVAVILAKKRKEKKEEKDSADKKE